MFRKRREDPNEMLERLRLVSAECSGDGLEETDAREVEQAAPQRKEYCDECHLAFGLAEKRVALDRTRVAHEDCYVKILRRQQERANRITAFTRTVH